MLRTIKCSVIIIAVMLLLGLKASDKAPDFQLKDQFDKDWKLANLHGRVVVVIGANRHSGEAMDPWVGKLKDKYQGKIQTLGLLDLHDVPGIGRGIAKSRIRKETNDPMMLDFRGQTSKGYEISDKCPVVVVIDKSGIIKSVQKSTFDDSSYKAVTEAIDRCLLGK